MMAPAVEAGWHTPVPDDHPAAALLCAEAVRKRCATVSSAVVGGRSPFFEWHAEALPETALYVADTIRLDYPDLDVPYHSRWRLRGRRVDRWQALAGELLNGDRLEAARVAVDLVIPSVLLDAGAGPAWRFRDKASGQLLARSKVSAWQASRSSPVAPSRPIRPARCAATPRHSLGSTSHAWQPISRSARTIRWSDSAAGPACCVAWARWSARRPRCSGSRHDLATLSTTFSSTPAKVASAPARCWPPCSGHSDRYGRGVSGCRGIALGDCWQHPALDDELLPFHKLTQWLTYSLLEPLELAGLEVTGLDALTGLPEYRNGGLLLDFGIIRPRNPEFWRTRWRVDATAIVEWRALTVSTLDELAERVRAELGVDTAAFLLARVLQGGTWSAGRRIAAQRREGGPPPIDIVSDGTVF